MGKEPLGAPGTRVVRDGGGWKVEALVGGAPVSWLYVNDLKWRVGAAVVRMGGVGGVATPQEYRRKGYSRVCMEAALDLMRREGIPMSALFGIPGFYPKWGFASVIPEPLLTLPVAVVAGLTRTPGLRVMRFDKVRHGVAARRLYTAANRERSGTVVVGRGRRPDRKGSDWFVKSEAFVVTDRKESIVGYAAYDAKKAGMTVTEVGWRTPAVFPTLTAELARRARSRREETLRLFLPLDHPYALWLRRWNIQHGASYYSDGQGMARIVDLQVTLTACREELERRVRSARFTAGAVVLRTDIGTVTVAVRRGRVTVRAGAARGPVVRVPQAVLTQWLLGYLPVGAPSPAGRAVVPPVALPFLRALFPAGQPYLWHADRF